MSATVEDDFSRRPFLLVEDDSNDVYLLQSALPKAGLENALHVVNSGEDAIAYLSGQGRFSDRNLHPWPAVVLLDLGLPGKSGFAVLEWLANQPFRSQLAVIVMTNSNSKADADRATALSADLFVTKPSKFDALVELTRCLHYWLRLNRSRPTTTPVDRPVIFPAREEPLKLDAWMVPCMAYGFWRP